MECVVDFPCLGEAELVCDGRENLDYRERSFSFRDELWIGDGVF